MEYLTTDCIWFKITGRAFHKYQDWTQRQRYPDILDRKGAISTFEVIGRTFFLNVHHKQERWVYQDKPLIMGFRQSWTKLSINYEQWSLHFEQIMTSKIRIQKIITYCFSVFSLCSFYFQGPRTLNPKGKLKQGKELLILKQGKGKKHHQTRLDSKLPLQSKVMHDRLNGTDSMDWDF